MDGNAGFLSLIPPIIAIVLALKTKEVVFSLMVGVISGTTIYACMAKIGFTYSDSDRHLHLRDRRTRNDRYMSVCNPGRLRIRRPLLTDLRYNDPVVHRRTM